MRIAECRGIVCWSGRRDLWYRRRRLTSLRQRQRLLLGLLLFSSPWRQISKYILRIALFFLFLLFLLTSIPIILTITIHILVFLPQIAHPSPSQPPRYG